MTLPSTNRRAGITRLNSAADFAKGLGSEAGTFQLLVETWEGMTPHRDLSGPEAASKFLECQAGTPRHLSLRAFTETVEYAWLGTEGLVVRIGEAGEYDVISESLQRGAATLKLDIVLSKGRVIYRRLSQAPPVQKG